MTLKYKLTANFVAASLVPVTFLAGIAYGNAKFATVESAVQNLEAIAETTADRLERYHRQEGDETKLWSIIQDNGTLGDTGEILVARRDTEGGTVFLAASRHQGSPANLTALSRVYPDAAINRALTGESGRSATYTDFTGQPVFAVTRFLPETGWALSVHMSKAEVFSSLTSLRYTLIIMGAIVLAFCILIAYLTAVAVAIPVQNLTEATTRIAAGALDTPVEVIEGDDEVSALSFAFRSMTANLRELYSGLEGKVRERTHQLEGALQDVIKFKQAVQYSTDAVFITDREFRIIYVNPRLEALMGYRSAELLSQTVDFFRNTRNDPAVYDELFAVAARGQGVETDELINVRKDGSEFNAEFTFYPVKQHNQIQFYVGIWNDITQRKREERAKSEFVSLASHQLRTPLTAMRWGLNRLRKTFRDDQLSDSQRRIFDAAHLAAKNMADTIGTMLLISRLASGKLKLEPQPTDICAILAELRELYQAECAAGRKELVVTCPPEAVIQSDSALLKEVLSNLISNAIKYSLEGKTIWVTAAARPEGFAVSIQDEGLGIPKAEQGKVFSMFFRAENAQREKVGGTGLGLYLVYSLVAFLGGGISFASEENQGTTFSILLPLTPPANE
jgi:two-component system sensor histidine kinase VicK